MLGAESWCHAPVAFRLQTRCFPPRSWCHGAGGARHQAEHALAGAKLKGESRTIPAPWPTRRSSPPAYFSQLSQGLQRRFSTQWFTRQRCASPLTIRLGAGWVGSARRSGSLSLSPLSWSSWAAVVAALQGPRALPPPPPTPRAAPPGTSCQRRRKGPRRLPTPTACAPTECRITPTRTATATSPRATRRPSASAPRNTRQPSKRAGTCYPAAVAPR